MTEELATEEPRRCGWLVEGTPRWVTEAWAKQEAGDPAYEDFEWFPEEPGDCITECGAEVTDFDNGWRCAAGHSHFSGVEYYDDDEIAGLARRGLPLAPNAARMDGTRI